MKSIYVELAPGDSLSWEEPARPAPEPATIGLPKTGITKTEMLSFKPDQNELGGAGAHNETDTECGPPPPSGGVFARGGEA